MDLANFEFFANTGAAVVGATVTAYVASDTHPNPNSPAAASVNTNTNGKWSINGLADGSLYDIKVEHGANIKWYKANCKLCIGHLVDDTSPDLNRNLLLNGGADLWLLRGTGSLSLPTSDPGGENEADGWTAFCGTGDVATAQAESTTRATGSKFSSKIVYNRSSGQLYRCRDLPDGLWQQLKGQQISVSAQVRQDSSTSKVGMFIDDGLTETLGTVTDTVGSFVTVTATKTISSSATRVRIGTKTSRVDTGSKTFYVDNVIADLGSVAPVFAQEANDLALVSSVAKHIVVETTPSGDIYSVGGLFNALAHRVMSIIGAGGADWKDAIPRTLTQLVADIALKVAKAGDSMTGSLTISGSGAALTTRNTDATGSATSFGVLNAGGGAWELLIQHSLITINLATTLNAALTATTAAFSGAISAVGATLNGNLTHANNTGVLGTTTGAAVRNLVSLNSSNQIQVGDPNQPMILFGTGYTLSGPVTHSAGGHTIAAGNLTLSDGGISVTDNTGSDVLIATNSGAGRAAVFNGDVVVFGDFSVSGGTKSRLAAGRDGHEGLFHAVESPLPMFEEYGRAYLQADRAWVQLPRDFANYVDTELGYYVQVQPEGLGVLAVTDRRPWGFAVRLVVGQEGIPFSYRIVARQGDLTHIARNLPVERVD